MPSSEIDEEVSGGSLWPFDDVNNLASRGMKSQCFHGFCRCYISNAALCPSVSPILSAAIRRHEGNNPRRHRWLNFGGRRTKSHLAPRLKGQVRRCEHSRFRLRVLNRWNMFLDRNEQAL